MVALRKRYCLGRFKHRFYQQRRNLDIQQCAHDADIVWFNTEWRQRIVLAVQLSTARLCRYGDINDGNAHEWSA